MGEGPAVTESYGTLACVAMSACVRVCFTTHQTVEGSSMA